MPDSPRAVTAMKSIRTSAWERRTPVRRDLADHPAGAGRAEAAPASLIVPAGAAQLESKASALARRSKAEALDSSRPVPFGRAGFVPSTGRDRAFALSRRFMRAGRGIRPVRNVFLRPTGSYRLAATEQTFKTGRMPRPALGTPALWRPTTARLRLNASINPRRFAAMRMPTIPTLRMPTPTFLAHRLETRTQGRQIVVQGVLRIAQIDALGAQQALKLDLRQTGHLAAVADRDPPVPIERDGKLPQQDILGETRIGDGLFRDG